MTNPMTACIPPKEYEGVEWHWLERWQPEARPALYYWQAASQMWNPAGTATFIAADVMYQLGHRYLGPCLPDAATQIAQLTRERDDARTYGDLFARHLKQIVKSADEDPEHGLHYIGDNFWLNHRESVELLRQDAEARAALAPTPAPGVES